MSDPKASVIVLNWNGLKYLAPCLDAVLAQDYDNFEVIVVDNGSTDGSADFVAESYPQVALIRNERNLGFAAGNNVGLRQATGNVLVLLNQDTVVEPGWMAALVQALEGYPDAGIAGGKILDLDGQTLQHAGGHIEHPLALGKHYGYGELDDGQYEVPRQVEFVTGAAIAFKRQVLSTIGGLDEGFYPGYFEDVDFCLRARAAGYAVWYAPEAVLRHHESASMRRDSLGGHYYYYRSRLRFILKHYKSSQIVDGFAPAEIARISRAPFEELRASSLSTIEGMTLWPLMASQRRPLPSDAEYRAVLEALRRLQNTIITVGECGDRPPLASRSGPQQPELASGQVDTGASEGVPVEKLESKPAFSMAPRPEGESQSLPGLAFDRATSHAPSGVPQGGTRQLLGTAPYSLLGRELQMLSQSGQVNPQPFRSQVPLLGPLIVAFRDFVNNLATRWYVQGLLDQQVAFNASVSRMLSEVYSQSYLLPEHHSGFLAEQVADLHWQLLALKNEVARLKGELDERSSDAPH